MPAMYPLLQPHQKRRIRAMVSQITGDVAQRSDAAFQGYTAMTLVGAGQTVGNEKDHAESLVYFSRLPEPHNDMVFAVIGVRWGLLGSLGVIGLYLMFFIGGIGAAALNKDPFARLVAVGVVAVVFTQMFVNIGMTIGLLPITGMTLPLISYGGSSLVATFVMIGLVLGAASRRPMIMSRPSFEFTTAGNS
jgi:cell division protein FtsW (lipid II flippase)